MYPWQSVININRSSTTPLYTQIVNVLIREISSGRLAKQTKMPGTRQMSQLIEVNRKTVIQAYDELIAQGWLQSYSSSGTYVSDKLPLISPSLLSAERCQGRPHDPIRIKQFPYGLYTHKPKHLLEINSGTPDHRLAPMDWIYRECKSLTKASYGKHFLKYDSASGELQLKQSLSRYLNNTRGMHIGEENILITRGSQMGIFMALSLIVNTGDNVVTGDTSYDSADWAITHCGGNIVRIPVDENGLNTYELESLLTRRSIAALYLTPHHHYPTTVTLSAERRVHLLELSLRHNFAIIEDDYDYDFHYQGSPILPLASLSHYEHVIYVGSFSKIFAPAVRVGYLVASARMIEQLTRLRGIIDRQGDPPMEKVMALAIESGELQRHIKKSVKAYQARRDYVCELLTNNFSDIASFKIPDGGMAIWLKLKKDLSLQSHPLKQLCKAQGLNLNLSDEFIDDHHALRIGFASLEQKEMKLALEYLSKSITQLSS